MKGGGINPIRACTDGNGDESTNTNMDTTVGGNTDELKAELTALDRKREELIEKLRTELAPSKQTQHIRPTETANHVKHQQMNVNTSYSMLSKGETPADPTNVYHVDTVIRENSSGQHSGLQLDTTRDDTKQSTGGQPELRYSIDPRRLSPVRSVKIQYLHAKLDELVQLDANAKNISVGDDDGAHAAIMASIKRARMQDTFAPRMETEDQSNPSTDHDTTCRLEVDDEITHIIKEIVAAELDEIIATETAKDTTAHDTVGPACNQDHHLLLKAVQTSLWGGNDEETLKKQHTPLLGAEEAASLLRIESAKVGIDVTGRHLTGPGIRRMSAAIAIYRNQSSSAMRPDLAAATDRMMSGLVASLLEFLEDDVGDSTQTSALRTPYDVSKTTSQPEKHSTPTAAIGTASSKPKANSDCHPPDLVSDVDSESPSPGDKEGDQRKTSGTAEPDSPGEMVAASDSDDETTRANRAKQAEKKQRLEDMQQADRLVRAQQPRPYDLDYALDSFQHMATAHYREEKRETERKIAQLKGRQPNHQITEHGDPTAADQNAVAGGTKGGEQGVNKGPFTSPVKVATTSTTADQITAASATKGGEQVS